MPTAKPRITVTLEPHAHEVLSRLSRVGGDSMSTLVTQLLDVALPSLERAVVVLERAAAAPQEARAGLAAALDRAEREALPALMKAIDQRDLFLADLDAATGSGDPLRRDLLNAQAAATARGQAQPGRQLAASSKVKKAPKGASTPVPVTRGSGGYKSGRPRPAKGARRG